MGPAGLQLQKHDVQQVLVSGFHNVTSLPKALCTTTGPAHFVRLPTRRETNKYTMWVRGGRLKNMTAEDREPLSLQKPQVIAFCPPCRFAACARLEGSLQSASCCASCAGSVAVLELVDVLRFAAKPGLPFLADHLKQLNSRRVCVCVRLCVCLCVCATCVCLACSHV